MDNGQKKGLKNNIKVWLSNIYYLCTMLTLFFIMGQVFYAKRTMEQSNEWEKARMTIENIERFQNNLKATALYNHPEALLLGGQRVWPDFSDTENMALGDTLRTVYYSIFDDYDENSKDYIIEEDLKKTMSALDAFAYPIIMGYASELGSYQNAYYDYISYSNYLMYIIYNYGAGNMGLNARLLYRLWRVRLEQELIEREAFDDEFLEVIGGTDYLLCFEGAEVTPTIKKQYEKRLKKELKKMQKEIEEFRRSALN